MLGTQTETQQAATRPWQTTSLRGLQGRLGIVADGKATLAFEVKDGTSTLVAGGGAARAEVIVRTLDDLKSILSGATSLLVAALRGNLALEGDIAFAVKVLRALKVEGPINWPAGGAG
jgi:putative sterol carrier protein